MAQTISIALLAALLAVASWSDVRTRRIPNALVVTGVVIGLILNALGAGALEPGSVGLFKSAGGLCVGMGVLLPLYLLRGMGAGDVKLMGMVGAFLGPSSAVEAALATLVAGGVLAAAVALWKGTFARALDNVRFMMIESVARGLCGAGVQLSPAAECAGKVPYALAIASGTLLHLLLLRNGYSVFTH
jgi:prepilin peptidase CpaA